MIKRFSKISSPIFVCLTFGINKILALFVLPGRIVIILKLPELIAFLISKSLLPHVRSNKILPCTFSDHDFFELQLNVDGCMSRRSGVWKFNSTLLRDPDFKAVISGVINEQKLCINLFESLGAWWDNLKVRIRQACINFSKRKRSIANSEHAFLTKKLIRLKNLFHSGDVSVVKELNDTDSALSSLILKEAEGAKIRSRAQWIEEGEKPTRFFFRLESKRAEKNSFVSLLDDSGTEKTSQSDLEGILVKFYKDLFSKDSLDIQIQTELIADLELSLTDAERVLCEGLFTNEELLSALKGLQTGKSPGSDGLSNEFYLAFWNELGDL